MPVRLNSLTFNGAIHEIHGSTIVRYEVLSHRILRQDSLWYLQNSRRANVNEAALEWSGNTEGSRSR